MRPLEQSSKTSVTSEFQLFAEKVKILEDECDKLKVIRKKDENIGKLVA